MNRILAKASQGKSKVQEAYLRNKTGLEPVDAPAGVRALLHEHHAMCEECLRLEELSAKLEEKAVKMAAVCEQLGETWHSMSQRVASSPASLFSLGDTHANVASALALFVADCEAKFRKPFSLLCTELKQLSALEKRYKHTIQQYNLARMRLHETNPLVLQTPHVQQADPTLERLRAAVCSLERQFRQESDDVRTQVERLQAMHVLEGLVALLQECFVTFAQRLANPSSLPPAPVAARAPPLPPRANAPSVQSNLDELFAQTDLREGQTPMQPDFFPPPNPPSLPLPPVPALGRAGSWSSLGSFQDPPDQLDALFGGVPAAKLRFQASPPPPWQRPSLRVHCVTFNMAQQPPPPTLLPLLTPTVAASSLLASPGAAAAAPLSPHDFADVIALGLQESEYGSEGVDRDMQERVLAALTDAGAGVYECVAIANLLQLSGREAQPGKEWNLPNVGGLAGTRLFVFVRNELVPHIKDVTKSNRSTGVGGVGYNKGGVGVSLSIGNWSYCFVCSHFAAHQEQVSDRNADFATIAGSLDLGKSGIELGCQFDYVFWMGDLNYRVDGVREVVLQIVERNDLFQLVRNDQLGKEREGLRVFFGYHEHPLVFPPSYKYMIGTSEFEEKKKRIPSWCDRVLYRTASNAPIVQVAYGMAEEVKSSDHKPVFAFFDVPHPLLPSPSPTKRAPSSLSGVATITVHNLHVKLASPPAAKDLDVTLHLPLVGSPASRTHKAGHNDPSFCPVIRFRARVNWDTAHESWDVRNVIVAIERPASLLRGDRRIGACLVPVHECIPLGDFRSRPSSRFVAHVLKGGDGVGTCEGSVHVHIEPMQ